MQQYAFPYEISLKGQMPEAIQRLLEAAEAAASIQDKGADAQLSGAALWLTDGRVVTGAGSTSGPCAERAALDGLKSEAGVKVRAIAIAYQPGSADRQPFIPCGSCRQIILEQQLRQGRKITVYMIEPDGEVIMVEDAAFLLPFYAGGGNYL